MTNNVTIVDPPGGWRYGFPALLQGDYEKQLRDAGYPEADIPLALQHSRYYSSPMAMVPEAAPYNGTASDGDDGA